jgi:hypothetical protein
LYEILKEERHKKKKPELSEKPEFNGSPDKFSARLNEFLKNYK